MSGFGGGPGGFGGPGGHGAPGVHGGHGGFGMHGGRGAMMGLHSGGPPGHAGRGGFSSGHKSKQSNIRPPDHDNFLQPKHYSIGAANILIILTVILSIMTFAANVMAVKVWGFGPIRLDGGIIIFPLIYVIQDILVEVYFRKTANRIIICVALFNCIAFFLIKLGNLLPSATGVSDNEIMIGVSLSGRIIIASACASIVSGIINNRIYDNMREWTDPVIHIGRRAWRSSVYAHVVDTTLFTIIGFAGRMSPMNLLFQLISSLIAALIVEGILIATTIPKRISLTLIDVLHAASSSPPPK